MMQTRKADVHRQHHAQHELIHGHAPRGPLHRQRLFHQLLESELLQHSRYRQQTTVGRQVPAFEVIGRGSPDFIGLSANFFGPLFGGPLLAMLFFVDHRLGDSRKSAREVCPSRLFCFTAGFSGSPNGVLSQAARCGSTAVHKSTVSNQTPAVLPPAATSNMPSPLKSPRTNAPI